MAKNPTIKAGIYIGAQKEVVTEARKAVIDILNSKQEQATIQKALDVYQHICAVNNASISQCHIKGI